MKSDSLDAIESMSLSLGTMRMSNVIMEKVDQQLGALKKRMETEKLSNLDIERVLMDIKWAIISVNPYEVAKNLADEINKRGKS